MYVAKLIALLVTIHSFCTFLSLVLRQMGNCITLSSAADDAPRSSKALPINTAFKLPAPLPAWPPGAGFGSGAIDLGGLKVCRTSSFKKVWATYKGGPDDLGATFFEPSEIPPGFSMLGCYSQPNNRPFSGWVMVGGDDGAVALEKPVDYTLLWSSKSLKIKQDGIGYFWLPVPPDGYTAVGLVVTASPEKPPPDRTRCVRSDFTDRCEADTTIWDTTAFNVSSSRPQSRGTEELGVSVGTFVAQIDDDGTTSSAIPIACLKNKSLDYTSYMPNASQIDALVRTYAPLYYFHPDEKYMPSSVEWYFSNGALLYKKGEESKPVPIDPTGLNLPQGGSNDGAFWLDLPVDEAGKERVKKGDLRSSMGYLHVKPMYGATFTDIAIWLFYPFNGPATAKLEIIDVPLGKIGEHIGDWEHVTLRISNFDGELRRVYFSQHSGGTWVDASQLEFRGGGNGNRFVAYSSLNGHASYPKPGLVLQGAAGIGIRNDTAKSDHTLDTAAAFSVVAVDYFSGAAAGSPPWLDYLRKWGPNISYDTEEEAKKVESVLPGNLKSLFDGLMKSLPSEVFGEDGPTGPKVKANWSGDEA